MELEGGSVPTGPMGLRPGLMASGNRCRPRGPARSSNITHDNPRAVAAVGEPPAPFESYCAGYLNWVKEQRMRYPYVPVPAIVDQAA